MNFCHICGLKLTLGNENFCPRCGTNLQQKTAKDRMTDNNQSVDIQHTGGDVIGAGFSGSGNIIAKDTKGNIFYFHIESVSSEQLKNIITSSTTLDVSQSYKTADNTKNRELHNVTETKQQTGQVLEEINKVEKGEGREIQEIKVGEVQISKNELLLKEWILKGNEYYYKREYNEAIKCFDKALEIDPKYVDAWNNKGLALRKLGKHNEAIECFDKALEIDPKYVGAWYNIGIALHKLGKRNEAIECFDKAWEIDPNNASAWYNKGTALGDLGKYNEAIECFDKALEIDPKHAKALANRDSALRLLVRIGGGKKSGWKRFFK